MRASQQQSKVILKYMHTYHSQQETAVHIKIQIDIRKSGKNKLKPNIQQAKGLWEPPKVFSSERKESRMGAKWISQAWLHVKWQHLACHMSTSQRGVWRKPLNRSWNSATAKLSLKWHHLVRLNWAGRLLKEMNFPSFAFSLDCPEKSLSKEDWNNGQKSVKKNDT